MRLKSFVFILLLSLWAPPATWGQTSTEPFTPSGVEKTMTTVFDPKAPQENTLTLYGSEEYTDNVNESAKARSDMISIIGARGNYIHQASRFQVKAALDGSYNAYALGNHANEFKGSGQATATVAAVPNLLFLEGEDQFRQVYTSLTTGETNPTDTSRDQVTQNSSTARVYVTPHFNDRLELKLGTSYGAIAYSQSDNATDKQYYTAFGQSFYALTSTFKLSTETEVIHIDTNHRSQDKYLCSGGFIWNYSETGSFEAKSGPRLNTYSTHASQLDWYWNALLSQSFKRYTFSLDTSSLDVENPSTNYSSRTQKAGASLAWQGERLGLRARGEYVFLNGQETADTRQVNTSLTGSYDLTPRLTLKAAGSRNVSDQSGNNITRWYADGSLSYALNDRYSLECYYRWKIAESSSSSNNSYTLDRFGLSIKRTF